MKLWHSVDKILALDGELIVQPADKSTTSHAALTGVLSGKPQQHCGLCVAVAHVQITGSDSGAGWISGVPALNKASIVGCRCVFDHISGAWQRGRVQSEEGK